MDQAQLLGMVSLIVSSTGLIGYLVKLNHKRLRSTCCNITCVTSVDLEETTPPLKITIPENKDGTIHSSA
jgi:hypothetical protein